MSTQDSGTEATASVAVPPPEVAKVLEQIPALDAELISLDTAELRHSLDASLWRSVEPGSEGQVQALEEESKRRLSTQRWSLQELDAWRPTDRYASYKLQIILTTLLAACDSDWHAVECVESGAPLGSLLDGFAQMVAHTVAGARELRPGQSADEFNEELVVAGRAGDYRKLGQLSHHLRVELAPDATLAIMLLWKFAPDRLARHIEERQDFVFSLGVSNTLRATGPLFALSVNDVTFKFVCAQEIAGQHINDAPGDAVSILSSLLVQVANGPGWGAWLSDLAHYPHAETVAQSALTDALRKVDPSHWSGFINAVELWTFAGTAKPVANILAPLYGSQNAEIMWQLAFERWDHWDYGRDEKDRYLFAPSSCSFDCPVAAHYATLPFEEVVAEESRLLAAIASIEQGWFTDFSSLVSQRNRLSSRLRLVQHGLRIRRAGENEQVDALPPPIEPEDEFSRVRYRYFDPNKRVARAVKARPAAAR